MNVVLVSGMSASDFETTLNRLARDAIEDPSSTGIVVAGVGQSVEIELFDVTSGITYTGARALHMLITLKSAKEQEK